MTKRIARHVRQNAYGLLALFIALGGTSYAVATLPKNSVKAKQLAPNSVRSSEAKGLTLDDFKAGESEKLRGPKGEPGSQGERGPEGQRGEAGIPGPAGTPAAIARTVLPVTGQHTSSVPTYAMHSAGSFTKQSAGSRIDLTYATDLETSNASSSCRVQLRVDGATSAGSTGTDSGTVTSPGDARLQRANASAPAVVLASFNGLAAGSHAVTIAVATDSAATTCTENDANIPRQVIVEEIPPGP